MYSFYLLRYSKVSSMVSNMTLFVEYCQFTASEYFLIYVELLVVVSKLNHF